KTWRCTSGLRQASTIAAGSMPRMLSVRRSRPLPWSGPVSGICICMCLLDVCRKGRSTFQRPGRKTCAAARQPFELGHVVGREDRHLVAVLAAQGAQPLLVVQARGAVQFHHPLVEAKARRAPIALAHLVFVEIGITCE